MNISNFCTTIISLVLAVTSITSAHEIVIANYNVENLFDLTLSKKEYPKYRPSIEGWNSSAYHSKLKSISTVISQLSPDIITLQEIENRQALKDLMKSCNSKGAKFRYSLFGEDSSRSAIGVAILSKYPLTGRVTHRVNLSSRGRSRNILECRAKTNIGELRILAVHWPSKMAQEGNRIKAAKVVKSIIDTLPKGCEYMVIGDFNESFDESIRLLTEKMDNSSGETGVTDILNCSYSQNGEFYSNSAERVVGSSQRLLYDPWLEINDSVRYSYLYKGEKVTLDHILLPKTLLDSDGITYKDRSFRTFTMGDLLVDSRGVPIRWKSYKKDGVVHYSGEGFSDHLPIYVTLTDGKSSYKAIKSDLGSFETTHDGWVVKSNRFRAKIVTDQKLDGKSSLKFYGKSKRNSTMIYVSFIPRIKQTKATFYLAGDGKYSVRVKPYRGKKWLYYKGGVLVGSSQNSYTQLPESSWVKISLPIKKVAADTLTVEIRGKGSINNRFYLDKSDIDPLYRPKR